MRDIQEIKNETCQYKIQENIVYMKYHICQYFNIPFKNKDLYDVNVLSYTELLELYHELLKGEYNV